jgi:hypothetical protein
MPPSPTTETTVPAPPSQPNRRRFDLVLGIVLGIVLGLGIVSAFVFLGSEGSIDAPRIRGVDTGKPAARAQVAPAASQAAEPPRPRP